LRQTKELSMRTSWQLFKRERTQRKNEQVRAECIGYHEIVIESIQVFTQSRDILRLYLEKRWEVAKGLLTSTSFFSSGIAPFFNKDDKI